jgi:predicted HicB family RNase H-like nuclease
MLPNEKLTTQLHIRISPQLKDELDKAAGKQQTTVPVYCARRLNLSLLANLTPG